MTDLLNCADSGGPQEVHVDVQKAMIECSVEELVFPAVGGDMTFTVKCDKEWTAFGEEDWIRCEVAGSTEREGSVKVTVQPNPESETRTSSVIVKSGMTRTAIPLTQAEPLQVSIDKLYSSSKGETFTVGVRGADGWQVESAADWSSA